MENYPADEPSPHSPFLERDSPVRRSRRHLPHWRLSGGFYFVTWRLADSLPQEKLRAWNEEKIVWLREHPKPWDRATAEDYRERFPRRLEAWLDAGHGACHLRNPACNEIVAGAFHHFDGERYVLASYVIMPNHVHALFQLVGGWEIEEVVHSIKSYTANRVNRLLGRSGSLWQREGFDHVLRGIPQLDGCLSYIRNNPRVARLPHGAFRLYEAPGFQDLL